MKKLKKLIFFVGSPELQYLCNYIHETFPEYVLNSLVVPFGGLMPISNIFLSK